MDGMFLSLPLSWQIYKFDTLAPTMMAFEDGLWGR